MPASGYQQWCLVCQTVPPVHAALKPYVLKDGRVVDPLDYAVCSDCHRQQYVDVYGFTPEEAPSKAPPRDPFAAEYQPRPLSILTPAVQESLRQEAIQAGSAGR